MEEEWYSLIITKCSGMTQLTADNKILVVVVLKIKSFLHNYVLPRIYLGYSILLTQTCCVGLDVFGWSKGKQHCLFLICSFISIHYELEHWYALCLNEDVVSAGQKGNAESWLGRFLSFSSVTDSSTQLMLFLEKRKKKETPPKNLN